MKSIIPINFLGPRQVCVDVAYDGQRVDNYLLRELRGAPRTLIYRIIRSGAVRVNGKRVQADTRLLGSDVLRIPPLRLSERALTAERNHQAPPRRFPTLYDDAYFMAINKPAGVAVHGGSGVAFGVIEQLRSAYPTEKHLELVHRLDRETSGVLLVARRNSALRRLQSDFHDRHVDKQYLALVPGAWQSGRKGIDMPLYKYVDAQGERRVRVVAKNDPQGMTALTLVESLGEIELAGAGLCSLLAVRIKTGRTHQIRVHLAALGLGILGDEKYGDFALNRRLRSQLPRMFLHAWRLNIAHPHSGDAMQLVAPLPTELQAVLPRPLLQRLHMPESRGAAMRPEA